LACKILIVTKISSFQWSFQTSTPPLTEADLPARILAETERDSARPERAGQDRLGVIK